ncbi:MAG: glycoside hydrolase family 127 protein, partial [Blastocatellia bacterium]|nr:glycoside hydrolase family 127 protein [Blastocatellia bacterium]
PVTITEETEYPFRDEIRLSVNPERAVEFGLELRIPSWADHASISVNGSNIPGVKAGAFKTLDRKWRKGDQVLLMLPMKVRISHWYHNSIAIERGPLVYSLKIGEDWRKVEGQLREKMKNPAIPPAADWEVYPTSPWNYALAIDLQKPQVEVIEKPLVKVPFSLEGAPIELRVKGRRLPQWTMAQASAGPLPVSPVKSSEPEEVLTLIPYGAAKLRITAFPYLATNE